MHVNASKAQEILKKKHKTNSLGPFTMGNGMIFRVSGSQKMLVFPYFKP
jgi:hypothetical protein